MKAGDSLLCKNRLKLLQAHLITSLGLNGEIWECGVYAGGSAMELARTVIDFGASKTLRLFDTFTGITLADSAYDKHENGEFSDLDFEEIKNLFSGMSFVSIHKGVFPSTFEPFKESKICFAHVDCDVYASVKACIEFIWPRLIIGGVMIFDDFFHPHCTGATRAVNEFLEKDYADCHSGTLPSDLRVSVGWYPQIIFRKREK